MTDLVTMIKHEMETDEEDSAKRSQRLERHYSMTDKVRVKDALHKAIFHARCAKDTGNRERLVTCREFIRKYWRLRHKTLTL